mgnify:CR=1 FL=1
MTMRINHDFAQIKFSFVYIIWHNCMFKQKIKDIIGGQLDAGNANVETSVKKAIKDPNKIVIVSTSPSVRVALGEEFGFDYGVVISASHNPVEFNGIKIFIHL